MPFSLAPGEAWFSAHQGERLRAWVEANVSALLASWDGEILYGQDILYDQGLRADVCAKIAPRPSQSTMSRSDSELRLD